MTQGGFGRKGLADNDLERRKAAFIAAERQRRADGEADSGPAMQTPETPLAGFGGAQTANGFAAAPRRNFGTTAGPGYHDSGISNEQAREAIGMRPAPKPEKSLMLAYVYWYFAGMIGAHRFYLGAHKSGGYQLGLFLGALFCLFLAAGGKTLGMFGFLGLAGLLGCFVWILVDMFLIPGLRRKMARDHNYNSVFS